MVLKPDNCLDKHSGLSEVCNKLFLDSGDCPSYPSSGSNSFKLNFDGGVGVERLVNPTAVSDLLLYQLPFIGELFKKTLPSLISKATYL